MKKLAWEIDSKCPHVKINIKEMGSAFTEHSRESTGEWSSYSDLGCYNGILDISCPECGMKRTINRTMAPKWLKKYLKEIDTL